MRLFDELAERLLREGMAYRNVQRYVAELRDHAEDVIRDEMARGASVEDASGAAWVRLGTVEDLARGMIARTELRALSARFPVLWGGGGPLGVWLSAVLAVGLLIVGLVCGLKVSGVVPLGGSSELAAWQGPVDFAIAAVTRVFPVVVGGGALVLALRQRTALLWPTIGAGVLAVIAGAVQTTVYFSAVPEARSSLNLGFSISPETTLRAGIMFGAMLTPLLLRNRFTRFAL